MAQLDEISLAIGQLTNEAKAGQAHFARVYERLDCIDRKVSALSTEVQSAMDGVERVEPSVEAYKRDRNKALGALGLLMAFTAALGASMFKLIEKFIGSGS